MRDKTVRPDPKWSGDVTHPRHQLRTVPTLQEPQPPAAASPAGGTGDEQSVSHQAGTLFVGRAFAFIFAFALPLVLARILSQEDFGLYKQLFLIHATLVATLTFGFTASLFYFVPHHAKQRHQYVAQTVLALFVIGLVGAGVLIGLKSQVARLLNDPDVEGYIPYVAVFVVLSLVATCLESLMIILKQARAAASTALVSELLRAGLMIAAAAITHSMFVLVLAALAWAACRAAALLVYLRKMKMPLWTPPEWRRLVEQVRYALPFGLAVIVATLSGTLHQYVVSYFYTPAQFAIYSVGYLQIPLVAIAFESIADVTLVRLTELRYAGLLDEAVRMLGESVTKLCLLLLPLYVWLMISAPDLIVLLFTSRYEASIGVFRIFLITIPLAILNLAYVPRAFADTGFILKVNVVLLVLVGLLLGLLAPLGLAGAAVATVVATAITTGLIVLRVRTLFQVPLRKVLPWRRLSLILAASLIAGIPAWVVNEVAPFSVVTRLLLSGMLCVFCYGFITWKGALIGPDDKRRIIEMLRGLSRRKLPDRVSNEAVTIRTGVEG